MENLYLAHHGVKGQKWGVRHYQNTDGSYKPGAEGRYDPDGGSRKSSSRSSSTSSSSGSSRKGLSDKQKTALKVGAGVAGAAALAVGGKKTLKVAKNALRESNNKAIKKMTDQGYEIGSKINKDRISKRRSADFAYDLHSKVLFEKVIATNKYDVRRSA